jgi:ornithine carbamoyltransferase
MRGQDLLSVTDLDARQLELIIETAIAMKRDGSPALLAGQTFAFLFEKPSLRTRVSFEVGINQLGGSSIYLSPTEIGLGVREPIRDIARVLSSYVNALIVRTASQDVLTELADWASIPVVNALSDHEHPFQALADMLTVFETKGHLEGIEVAYVGDGNNVARSLAFACALAGASIRLASPEGYELGEADLGVAQRLAGNGAEVELVRDPREAVRGVDVVYTDVWTSMGQEQEAALRREAFAGYQVDKSLVALARSDAIVMHDLPAHRGEEISDDLIESSQSVVFRQAENRLHAQKAALALILGDNERQEV